MSPDEAACDIFECTRCGDCCKGYGGTVVEKADIHAIAAHLGMTAEEFQEKYCVLSGSRPVLVQQSSGYCAFWDQLCTIHPVKPRMCRQWPYIESVVKEVNNWRIMAGMCPGIRTNVPDEHIIACVKKKLRGTR